MRCLLSRFPLVWIISSNAFNTIKFVLSPIACTATCNPAASMSTIMLLSFFVSYIAEPRSKLAKDLKIQTDNRSCIITDHRGKTNIEGVWAVGDVRAITQSVAMAVGTGNYAAIMANKFLERESYKGVQTDHPEERFMEK